MNKWILIGTEDDEILLPNTYNTYEEAYKAMEREFNLLAFESDYSYFYDNYAVVKDDYHNWAWRIYEVK